LRHSGELHIVHEHEPPPFFGKQPRQGDLLLLIELHQVPHASVFEDLKS
jgi:hypothetical protein